MSEIVPDAIIKYIASHDQLSDAVLDDVLRQSTETDMSAVRRETGMLLHVLTMGLGAKRVLEVGTGFGYSALWIARALKGRGMLTTIEVDPRRAAQAQANLERGCVGQSVNVNVGEATEILARLTGQFDLIFQDGDKRQYESLLDRLVDLLRPGGVLVVDNMLWHGRVIPGYTHEESRTSTITKAVVAFTERLIADRRLHTAIIPIGDGVTVSVKAD